MDILFQTIADLLDSLIPSGASLSTELATFNELLAYLLTIGGFWVFFIRPILKIFRLVK